jgi:hypothetical protein
MYYLTEIVMKLSEVYQGLGNYQKAVPLVQEAHAIQEANHNKLGLAKTRRVMPQDFLMRGEFDTMWFAEAEAIETDPLQQAGAGSTFLTLLIGWSKALKALRQSDTATGIELLKQLILPAYQMQARPIIELYIQQKIQSVLSQKFIYIRFYLNISNI